MSRRIPTYLMAFAIAAVATCGSSAMAQAHAKPTGPKSRDSRSIPQSPRVFEDREIKVTIPAGWRIVPDAAIKESEGPAMSLGNSVIEAEGKLILEKKGYTLGIAYLTGHASGVEGGRFIEAFNIPWLELDDAWDCSMYLGGSCQPASRVLVFHNLIVNSGDPQVREHCGIQDDLGSWHQENGLRQFDGERRWFGGSFATADSGVFFDSKGKGCGLKAYTLTFQAKTPDRLPVDGDPKLKKMIQEAIDIVDSIHYKRCAPAP